MLEFFTEYDTKINGMPVSVFGNYVKNTAAATNQDTGWLIGGKLNKAKDPGSWELSYDYRKLEPMLDENSEVSFIDKFIPRFQVAGLVPITIAVAAKPSLAENGKVIKVDVIIYLQITD